MIAKALTLILRQLNENIPDFNAGEKVVLGNIALAESQDHQSNVNGRVVLSLVNIEEESTLKNSLHYLKNNSEVTYRNPPINLNLYLLFSASFPGNEDAYGLALKRLSQ